jgi:hypothetical protein
VNYWVGSSARLGLAGGLFLYLLWPSIGIPEDINAYLQNIGLTKERWPYFIAYFLLINPWLEEYYWRGYLGSYSKRVVIEDVLFSGYHVMVLAGKIEIIWLIAILIVLSLIAWLWRQANRWSRGLLPSLMSFSPFIL